MKAVTIQKAPARVPWPEAPIKPQGKFQKNAKQILKDWQLYSMVIVPVIYFLIFKYGPMIGNLIAFRNYVPGGPWLGTGWVGLEYFKMFITNATFWNVFKNTFVISIVSLVLGFPCPIIFALLLNEVKNKTFKRTVQTISYLPYFLSIVVVAGMIMDILSPSGGMINEIVKAFTGHTVQFMQLPQCFVWIYSISGVWQYTGWNAILYLAALSNINTELYEAAEIDGAGKWKQTWHVTLPGIMPTISILLILNVGQIFNVGFEKVLLLQNPMTYSTADVISTYLYRMGLQMNNFSYATAIGLFESVIDLVLLVLANTLSQKFTENSLW